MLPGFNHNIRYKERVFHVQTEDNGVQQARVVTQLFLGGTVLALERFSYADVLSGGLDADAKNNVIRTRMQEQHKFLMKSLIAGVYDSHIEAVLRATTPKAAQEVPPELASEAELLPIAELGFATAPERTGAWNRELEEIAIDVVEESPSHASAAETQMRTLDDRAPTQPPEARAIAPIEDAPQPVHAHAADETVELSVMADEQALLAMVDRELGVREGSEPGRELLPTRAPSRTGSDFSARAQRLLASPDDGSHGGATPRPSSTSGTFGASDTLVDFALPAGLRERLRREIADEPERRPKNDARVARFRMAAETEPESRGPSAIYDAETLAGGTPPPREEATDPRSDPSRPAGGMRDVGRGRHDRISVPIDDEELASDRTTPLSLEDSWAERLDPTPVDRGPRATPAPRDPRKKPRRGRGRPSREGDDEANIVVAERSLDEVILSYLSDEDE